jgi:hypothetical protein
MLKREVTLPESRFIFHRALGQGAFGEVYQGFFRHRVGDAVEMPVAVKVCKKPRNVDWFCFLWKACAQERVE